MEKKSNEEKIVDKEVRQSTFLETLGFAQLVFDFYMAPAE
jgi:hypothetical protein